MLIEKIAHSELFAHIPKHRLHALLSHLNPRIKRYGKGEYVHRVGDVYNSIGMVLSGKVVMSATDFWGNRNLIKEFGELEFYGDSHSVSNRPMFFDIVAVKQSELLFLNMENMLTPWSSFKDEQQILLANMLNICAHKKLGYMHKSDCLSRRNAREKIKAFLSEQATIAVSNEFIIPYNRQHLADYLAVDRSTLSRELSKMKQEGLLDFTGKRFRLIKPVD